MHRRSITIVLLFLCAIVPCARAQAPVPLPGPVPRYGLYSDINWNLHSASFTALPRVPNCCPDFQSGSGAGGTLGVLFEVPLSPDWWLALRGSYSAVGATLSATEHTTVILDNSLQDGEIEHTIAASIPTIGLEPMGGFRPFGNFMLYAGARLGMVLSTSFEQKETLTKPEDRGTFYDSGTRTRNDTSGTIPDASSFSGALLFGLSNELRLNARGTLWAAPELFFALGLTRVSKDLSWRANSLRFGVSLKYSPRDAAVPAPAGETLPVAPETPASSTPTHSPLDASIAAYGLDASMREMPNAVLRVEEFVSTSVRPLLNYVFFDQGSSEIPARYVRIDPAATSDFTIDRLHDVDVLPTYYQILNVIGRRLTDHPGTTVRIVGCNDDVGEEKGNDGLSGRRAESVREYLARVWKIAPERMKLESRGLPEKASSAGDSDGVAENRRVEILSDSWEIMQPVMTNDTIRRVTPQAIRFRPQVTSEAGVAQWRVEARQNDQTLTTMSGEGDLPPTLEWRVGAGNVAIPRAADPIVYELTVHDKAGRSVTTPLATIGVAQITIRKKRQAQVADKAIDRYSLILFDFDRAELNGANRRIADFIRERLGPEATVSIVGYTDRLGDVDHNLRLSEARARAMASALGLTDARVQGLGESNLYDNTLPEGRFYCRTVIVEAERQLR